MAYIDTKYLFKCETCRRNRTGMCDTWCESGECYQPDMSKIPIVDGDGVKHGRWFVTDSFDHHKTPIYQCSVCRKEVADNYINLHKHCLHCGAKMDEGTDCS